MGLPLTKLRETLSTDEQDLTVADAFTELDEIEAEFARKSLRLFLPRFWSVIEPEQPFLPNWHINLMCNELEALEKGDVVREIFNVPPGTMKSYVIEPRWMWLSGPHGPSGNVSPFR